VRSVLTRASLALNVAPVLNDIFLISLIPAAAVFATLAHAVTLLSKLFHFPLAEVAGVFVAPAIFRGLHAALQVWLVPTSFSQFLLPSLPQLTFVKLATKTTSFSGFLQQLILAISLLQLQVLFSVQTSATSLRFKLTTANQFSTSFPICSQYPSSLQ